MENAKPSCRDGRRCLCRIDAASGCLTADQAHALILNEVIKGADRIGSATDTCQHRIRQSSLLFQHLLSDLFGNDRLKITHDRRERMRSHDRAEYIMRIRDSVRPLTHRL